MIRRIRMTGCIVERQISIVDRLCLNTKIPRQVHPVENDVRRAGPGDGLALYADAKFTNPAWTGRAKAPLKECRLKRHLGAIR